MVKSVGQQVTLKPGSYESLTLDSSTTAVVKDADYFGDSGMYTLKVADKEIVVTDLDLE
jgi:hypothetical protein